MVYVHCFICGKERNKTPAQLKQTKHNFCSRKCFHTYREYIKHNNLNTEFQKKLKYLAECKRLQHEAEVS